MFDAVLKQHRWPADPPCLARALARETPLLAALSLALELAGEAPDPEPWRKAMQEEARRRLYPARFGAAREDAARVAGYFFPLAQAVLPRMAPGDSIAARMPFQPLAEDELSQWPSGEEYRRLMEHLRA